MNKLDKQFEQMMKGIRIDSPSPDFSLRVMSRIQAEAAVQKQSLLHNYQPVISRRTWIILIVAFLLLMIYITVSSQEITPANEPGIWSSVTGKLANVNTREVSKIWAQGMNMFLSVPPVAYLILTATMALWTLDSLLIRLRHDHSKIKVN